jgi:rhodanese-related sulfurtransferase
MAVNHSSSFLDLVSEAKSRIQECSVEQVYQRQTAQESFYLVDVREESEWQTGHLPGAIHISKGILERDIESWIPDKSADIVLYCGGGYRSALAADNLQRMGYTRVKSMATGIRGWREAGYPEEG